jgi:membrane protease YdiL (CAAX protease family)
MKNSKWFIAYLVGFFTCWTFYVVMIYPVTVMNWGRDSLATALMGIFIRMLLWLLPVYCFLKYVDKVNPVQYLKLNIYNSRVFLSIMIGGVGYGLVYLMQYGFPQLDQINITWSSILGVALTVGIFEESVFRGFIMQKLAERTGFWPANILASILFVLIHFPGWFLIGLNPNIPFVSILAVMLLGLLMGLLVKQTKSLWPAIIVHQLNDIFAVIIWG